MSLLMIVQGHVAGQAEVPRRRCHVLEALLSMARPATVLVNGERMHSRGRRLMAGPALRILSMRVGVAARAVRLRRRLEGRGVAGAAGQGRVAAMIETERPRPGRSPSGELERHRRHSPPGDFARTVARDAVRRRGRPVMAGLALCLTRDERRGVAVGAGVAGTAGDRGVALVGKGIHGFHGQRRPDGAGAMAAPAVVYVGLPDVGNVAVSAILEDLGVDAVEDRLGPGPGMAAGGRARGQPVRSLLRPGMGMMAAGAGEAVRIVRRLNPGGGTSQLAADRTASRAGLRLQCPGS